MHRHHQRLVNLVQIRREAFDGRLRIQDDRVLETQLADSLQLHVQVAVRLDVHLDRLGAGRGELLQIEIGARHHQVDVAVEAGSGPLCERDDVGAEREVRDKVRVHDVEVQRLGARGLGPENLVREPSEIGREQRRQDFNLHRLIISF